MSRAVMFAALQPLVRRAVLAGTAAAMLSVFIREPEFVGQTKDRLATTQAARLVEGAVRDHFDNWLANLAAAVTGPVFDGGRRQAEVLELPQVLPSPLVDATGDSQGLGVAIHRRAVQVEELNP